MHPKESIMTTINSKGQITIPTALEELHLNDQDEIIVLVYDEHIEIYPISFEYDNSDCIRLSEKSLAKIWDSPEEDKAWAYLQENK